MEQNLTLNPSQGDSLPQPERLVWLDILRIFASLLIVTLNISAPYLETTPVGSPAWQAINAYTAFARASTPLFVLMSSVLFLRPGKELSLRQLFSGPIRRIVVIYIVWSILFAIFIFFTESRPVASPLSELLHLTLTGHYHMWFLPVLTVLYLLSPFLKLLLREEQHTLVNYALGIFLVGILAHTLLSAGDLLPGDGWLSIILGKFPFGTILLFLGYFLLGYLLAYRYAFTRKQRIWLYAAAALALALTVYLTCLLSIRAGVSDQRLSDRLSLTTLLVALAVFLAIRHGFSRIAFSQRARTLIAGISRLTLGVFLVHPMIVFLLDKTVGFNVASFSPLFSIPLLAVASFSLSALLIYLIKRIPGLCWLA